MKKSFSQYKQKKNRGVAVIFTLGILGLLTVMALGFASTALLNRKIADNTSSAEYARLIAKNIALARAKNAVLRNAVTACFYSSPISGQSDRLDFLHKTDTFLDGVRLFYSTESETSATYTTPASSSGPGPVRWQYVLGPDKNAASDKYPILGRYAYVVAPATGLLDPSVHQGQNTTERYGFSTHEIPLPANCGLSAAQFTSLGTSRWGSYSEIFKVLSSMDAVKKDFFEKDGIGIHHAKSAEAFWIDLNSDGKRTPEEMFLRCNLPKDTAGWQTLASDDGVKTLIGANAGQDFKTLADTDVKSISFIPWLKTWTYSHGDWTAEFMKKQIAANLIQYNLPGPTEEEGEGESKTVKQETISDKMGQDWLVNPPSYAGIGRHPMLNEIGICIRIKAKVTSTSIGTVEDPEYEYEPSYEITIDNGVELINPFSLTTSAKCFVKFPVVSDPLSPPANAQQIVLKMRSFNKGSEISPTETALKNLFCKSEGWFGLTHKRLKLTLIGNKTIQKLEKRNLFGSTSEEDIDYITGWTNVGFEREFATGDWSDKSGYTKAGVFWKEDQTESTQKRIVTFEKFRLKGADRAEDIQKLMRFYSVSYKPGDVALYYVEEKQAYQRDFAALSGKSEASYTVPGDWWSDDAGEDISEKERMFLYSIEAKDPLVNHKAADWSNIKSLDSAAAYHDAPGDTGKKYPGTVFDEDGGQTDEDGCHRNSTLPANLLESSGTPLEVANDPAYSTGDRLSTSYIRHEPMKSLWELGCISRAKAFETLNLSKARTFSGLTSSNYTTEYKADTFENGDANILDQVKFSEGDDAKAVYGKINLNSQCHNVFRQMFNLNAKWNLDLTTSDRNSPYPNPFTGTDGSTENNALVCRTGDCPKSTSCLAHLLMERSKILPFANRSDLLVSEADIANLPGYTSLSAAEQSNLVTKQRNLREYLLMIAGTLPSGLSQSDLTEGKRTQNMKWTREQFAARFMNLLSADPVDHVFIIAVAQSIRDIGGAPAFVDWNGDGEFDPAAAGIDISETVKFLKTGYVRKKINATTGYQKVGDKDKVPETISSTTIGEYDYGADKITGEAKLIVEMLRDPITANWRITGYRYAE